MSTVYNITVSITFHVNPNQTIRRMADPVGFFFHTFPPSSHYTYNTHTNTYHESFDYSIYLCGYHTLRNCCSTTSIELLSTSQHVGHFLRVDSQCRLIADIGLTSPHLCCVTQVNRFTFGH